MQKIYIEEVCTLIAEVSWIHDKGKSCNIIVHQDHAHLLADNAWFFINEFIANKTNMLYIDQHKLHMLSLVENLLHLSTIYSYAVPLAELYFCQALCYTNDPKKTVEEKLFVLDSTIATAEAHLTMRKRDVGQQLQVRPTVSPEELIKDTIKKMWTLYRQRFGNPVGTVRLLSNLKNIVISSLQTGSKTTFTVLQKIAAISAKVEMLEYHMDLGVANRDPETVELIQKNGGIIRGEDQAGQTLRFSMLPEKLTSTLQARLGLEKISITDTSTRVSVWIRKIQRMFTGITVRANCVVTDDAPYVAADYFLTYRQPLQPKVNQALQEQHVPNRQSIPCTPGI